ncbi:glycosyltransferase family 61 protein [Halobacteria archaeon AArc-curdl1]|uniref:Glycosyltransferase family 61 protein n=1 Tax=Natronosalvus hydrolyticus TaxID=2979988 RepID=A0AAP3E9U1_9EURY|nr:glycosyltransferase family 61 protein [Halobacteria archaeon AArc-curdl1]
MMHKFERAVEILRDDGPSQLSKKTISFLHQHYQKQLFRTYFSDNNIISDDQLPEISDQVWYLDEESPIEYSQPTGDRAPADFTQYTSGPHPEQRFVCNIPSCTLVGPSAVGFTDKNKLILATASGDKSMFTRKGSLFLGDVSTREVITQSYLNSTQNNSCCFNYVFPLVPFYDQYYYHWMVEYLPKLRALEKYEQKSGVKPNILIPADPPSFVTESLSLLGYESNRWREWNRSGQLVKNLIVTNHRHHLMKSSFSHSPDDYYWLQNRMRSIINSTSKSGRKIYISRQQAERGRKVVNYDQVIEELESRGFESLVMESLPLIKQVEIMMQADVIMGPHGAGLVNMIFSNNPKIIELLPVNDLRPHFYMLADLLDFEYNSLIAEVNDQHNIIVDTQELSTLLDEASV